MVNLYVSLHGTTIRKFATSDEIIWQSCTAEIIFTTYIKKYYFKF